VGGSVAARQNQAMTDDQLQSWWGDLTPEQRGRAAAIASQPAPRGMAIDDLSASMIRAGLPTSRMVWTGQPEHLVEMLDDVADFVVRASARVVTKRLGVLRSVTSAKACSTTPYR
jgi:hypothetical protein